MRRRAPSVREARRDGRAGPNRDRPFDLRHRTHAAPGSATIVVVPCTRSERMEAAELWLSWGDAALVTVTAVVIYLAAIAYSRIFGQRQFSSSSSYDLVFTFALGTLIGRAVLVRTSLGAALLGLGVLFALHALTGWLHHHIAQVHQLLQNRPILVAVDGRIREEGIEDAKMSVPELQQAIRLHGIGSLAQVRVAVLERNGSVSVIQRGAPLDAEVLAEVQGADAVAVQR